MLKQNQIMSAGIVGAGGAGFPTHVKLNAQADTLVCNAAECEPLLHKDKEILRHFPEQVVMGLQAVAEKVGAERIVIGIKKKYKELISFFTHFLSPNMEIFPIEDVYPSGDEFILVYETLGRVIPPGGLPIQVGVVVVNVETALNVANALKNKPVTHKFLTVAGTVAHPMSLRVPIGCTLADCIRVAGNSTLKQGTWACLVGGPMMGYIEAHPESARVTKTTGGIILLPREHSLVEKMLRPWNHTVRIAKSGCDQCTHCTEMCPRNLLGHPVEPHKAMRSLLFGADVLVPGTQFCSGCNLCTHCSCPENLDPRSIMQANRRKWAESGKRLTEPVFRRNRADYHMRNRQTPLSRLIRRLGLTDYDVHANFNAEASAQLENVQIVQIALRQHIGVPCVPIVDMGQTVRVGDVLAIPPHCDGKQQLGASIHASIPGRVTEIMEGFIVIQHV